MKGVLKCPDKIAYIWKAALQCCLCDGETCGFQQMLCVGSPQVRDILRERKLEMFPEIPGDIFFGHMEMSGEIVQGNTKTVILLNIR